MRELAACLHGARRPRDEDDGHVGGREGGRAAGHESLDRLGREGRGRAAVLDEDARGRLGRRSVAERVALRQVEVHAGRQDAVDAPERPLQLARQPGHELSVLGRLARDELAAIGRVEQAARLGPRQLLVAHGREGPRRVVARDGDAELPLGLRVGLFDRVDAGLIEGDDDTVRVGLVERGRDRDRAAGEREGDGGEDSGGARTRTHRGWS